MTDYSCPGDTAKGKIKRKEKNVIFDLLKNKKRKKEEIYTWLSLT